MRRGNEDEERRVLLVELTGHSGGGGWVRVESSDKQ
jgi:hypothetical protein